MSNCAKCGAELIGSKKFCAACGTPVTDPRATGSSPSVPASPAGRAPPPSKQGGVNPCAATAFPGKKEQRPSMYGPPPELAQQQQQQQQQPASPAPPNAEISQMTPNVSPLAVSNAMSQRSPEVD